MDEYYNDPIEPDEPTVKWAFTIYVLILSFCIFLAFSYFIKSEQTKKEMIELQNKLTELQDVIKVYDDSDKVYKNFVINGKLIVYGNKLTFIGGTINASKGGTAIEIK